MKMVKVTFGVILVVLILLFVIFSVKSLKTTSLDDIGDDTVDLVNDIIHNDGTEDITENVILLKNEELTDVQSCVYKFDTGSNIVTVRCTGYTDEYNMHTPVCFQLRHDSIDDYFKYIFNEHICNEMGLYWHEGDINQGCYYTIDLVDEDMRPINFNYVAGVVTYSGNKNMLRTSDYYFDSTTNRICIIPDSVIDNNNEIVQYDVNAFLNTQKSLI